MMIQMDDHTARLTEIALEAETLRLFLDYDGTLDEFAPSPDIVLPNNEIISLLEQLVSVKGILPAVISGRRLAHIQKLLPVEGLLIAGTYGLEMRLPDGTLRYGIEISEIRAFLECVQPRWRKCITGVRGMELEDKGYTLALHGRRADRLQAEGALEHARKIALEMMTDQTFRLTTGDLFLEIAPEGARKSSAVQTVLEEYTPGNAGIIYIGDDERDEEAFQFVLSRGGIAVRVASSPVSTLAQYILESPAQVREWLKELVKTKS
jgi:trehalose 6-phosphate phosphatase